MLFSISLGFVKQFSSLLMTINIPHYLSLTWCLAHSEMDREGSSPCLIVKHSISANICTDLTSRGGRVLQSRFIKAEISS